MRASTNGTISSSSARSSGSTTTIRVEPRHRKREFHRLGRGPDQQPGQWRHIGGCGGPLHLHRARRHDGHLQRPDQSRAGRESNLCQSSYPLQATCRLIPESISSPDGRTVALSWEIASYCTTEWVDGHLDCQYFWRLYQVENSFGYRVSFTYNPNGVGGGTYGGSPSAEWRQRTASNFYNTTVSQSSRRPASAMPIHRLA